MINEYFLKSSYGSSLEKQVLIMSTNENFSRNLNMLANRALVKLSVTNVTSVAKLKPTLFSLQSSCKLANQTHKLVFLYF